MEETPKPGTCEFGLSLTLPVGNNNYMKVSLSFSEPYSGLPGDTRDEKLLELLDYTKERLHDSAEEVLVEMKKQKSRIKHSIDVFIK
jgi:hypothetical protein